MAVTIPEETLSDDAPVLGRGPTHAWLIYIGSSENDFSEAGRVWSLDGLSKVHFGRVSGAELRDEREGDESGAEHPDEVIPSAIPDRWRNAPDATPSRSPRPAGAPRRSP